MYAYIHIPFCKSKCSYCDFFSVVSNEESLWSKKYIDFCNGSTIVPNEYVDALINEAAYQVRKHSIKAWKSLYIGGGTPSLLTVEQVETLLRGLFSLCPLEVNAEVTFEVNPFELSSIDGVEYLNKITDFGVNRISCGIQALDDSALLCVNRRSSKKECISALEVLKNWRSTHNEMLSQKIKREYQFSVDIISGLPNLTTNTFQASLTNVLSYKPNHVSMYSLMVQEKTPLFNDVKKKIVEYNEETSDEQWLLGRNLLIQYGYTHYEVSNFSSSHLFESEHNKAYWRMDNYIGLGSGACGTVDINRYTGTQDVLEYCTYWQTNHFGDEVPPHIWEQEVLTTDECVFEYLMMGFRTLKGVNSNEFYNRFGITLEERISLVFSKWEQKGFAKKEGAFYALNEKGILYLNAFLSEIV